MTIKPIDFQTSLPRIPEVGKVQQVRDSMPRTDQEHLQQQMVNEKERQTHQVLHSEQKEQSRIRDGQERHGQDQGRGRKHPEEEGEEAAEKAAKPTDPLRGRFIDISI